MPIILSTTTTTERPELRTLIELHVEAVLERLRDDTQLFGLVFDGDVRGEPERYINVWHDTGFYTSHDAGDQLSDVEITFTIHSVGDSRWQAVWGSGRVTAQLLGWVPRIYGRRCWRIASAGSQPVTRDTDAEAPVYFAADRFTLRSTPA